ncbi:MAG: phenylacetate--CoA ligase family protein [Anaerolineae bacterium]
MDIPIVLSLLTLLRQSRGHDRWTPEKLAQHQAHALAKLRLHAYTHSPFYRRFHEDGYESPLHDLPVLTKKMLMANFDEVVTDPRIHLDSVKAHVANASADALYLGRYWVNATSGSTGNPGLFLFNHREWAAVLLSFIRGYEWAGIIVNLLHRRKVALVASRNVSHMSAQVGFTLESPWASTTHISAMEPLTSIVERLNEAQPEILVAYASMARLLAVEQLEKRLSITPKVIFASAEVVTEETRRMVNSAWGDCLYNEYAATETAGIAAECQQHHMHLFEDSVIVENVDEHYQPVPAGVYGAKLLVTVLFNDTQPLIRYELSDSVRLSDEICTCGRPFPRVRRHTGTCRGYSVYA